MISPNRWSRVIIYLTNLFLVFFPFEYIPHIMKQCCESQDIQLHTTKRTNGFTNKFMNVLKHIFDMFGAMISHIGLNFLNFVQ